MGLLEGCEMRWQGQRQSGNVEDRRGTGYGRPVAAGGCGFLLLGLLALFLFGDPSLLLQQATAPEMAPIPQTVPPAEPGMPDTARDFVATVLADTEETWGRIFAERGSRYVPPTLVLFEQATRSACGLGSSAMGPFYCSVDQKVYIDLSFYDDLARRFGAPGDFAQAYVLAHEIGHHVQNLIGVMDQVNRLGARIGEAERNALSVRQELQADCFAGIWGHHAAKYRDMLEPGDVEEGLRAAAAIGDDRIQRQTQGYVVPESWTHGSSEQRLYWFRRGLESGNIDSCDTFQQLEP